MWIIGLTGAIGAGKSWVSSCFRQSGVPVHCADHFIHFLLNQDKGIQQKIKSLWPEVFLRGKIDRTLLGDLVFSSRSHLHQLESLLYPKLVQAQKKFLQQQQYLKKQLVVLDVPLLFEVGLDTYCDYVLVASSPFSLRKQRVMRRKGMTLEKFQCLESLQMKELTRRKKADFIIYTGLDKSNALKIVQQILFILSLQTSLKWQGNWPKNIERSPHESRNCFRYGNNRT